MYTIKFIGGDVNHGNRTPNITFLKRFKHGDFLKTVSVEENDGQSSVGFSPVSKVCDALLMTHRDAVAFCRQFKLGRDWIVVPAVFE